MKLLLDNILILCSLLVDSNLHRQIQHVIDILRLAHVSLTCSTNFHLDFGLAWLSILPCHQLQLQMLSRRSVLAFIAGLVGVQSNRGRQVDPDHTIGSVMS